MSQPQNSMKSTTIISFIIVTILLISAMIVSFKLQSSLPQTQEIPKTQTVEEPKPEVFDPQKTYNFESGICTSPILAEANAYRLAVIIENYSIKKPDENLQSLHISSKQKITIAGDSSIAQSKEFKLFVQQINCYSYYMQSTGAKIFSISMTEDDSDITFWVYDHEKMRDELNQFAEHNNI